MFIYLFNEFSGSLCHTHVSCDLRDFEHICPNSHEKLTKGYGVRIKCISSVAVFGK